MSALVEAGKCTQVELNNSTAVVVQPNHQAETFLATTDQRANRRPSWLVKLSTTHRIRQELRRKQELPTDFGTVATLRTLITMQSTAQVQLGPIPTSITLAMSNTARAILARAIFVATNAGSCDGR
jgi:hypothetical protein